MTALIVTGVIVVAIFVACAFTVDLAPYGWEDETGFHYGKKGKR